MTPVKAVVECGRRLVCAVSALRHPKTWLVKPTPPFSPPAGGQIVEQKSRGTFRILETKSASLAANRYLPSDQRRGIRNTGGRASNEVPSAIGECLASELQ